MSSSFDSSVLIAALVDSQLHHDACRKLLGRGRCYIFAHALAEVFSTLTGGKLGYRVSAPMAAELVQVSLLGQTETVTLLGTEIAAAMQEAESRGVPGGAIHDYLHLVAARKAGARRLYTLDSGNFESFHRAGDPEIVHP